MGEGTWEGGGKKKGEDDERDLSEPATIGQVLSLLALLVQSTITDTWGAAGCEAEVRVHFECSAVPAEAEAPGRSKSRV